MFVYRSFVDFFGCNVFWLKTLHIACDLASKSRSACYTSRKFKTNLQRIVVIMLKDDYLIHETSIYVLK